jgi:GAF domain-containing protein
MTSSTTVETLSEVAQQLVSGADVTDLLARMIRAGSAALEAQAVGILVRTPTGGLELLASTSHRAADLELFQVRENSGPCVDTVETGHPVSVVGKEEVRSRWPVVGRSIVESGYSSVHGFPLVWRGRVLGGLNLFTTSEESWDEERLALGQIFADVSTLAVVHLPELSERELTERVEQALEGRVVIEQAKGVLAHVAHISTEEAYDRLTALATERGTTLTATAQTVIRAASEQARRDGS